jgi:hypothetical protein
VSATLREEDVGLEDVGLEDVGEGVWAVHFYEVLLGRFNEQQLRLVG